jgi:hypothetical protein
MGIDSIQNQFKFIYTTLKPNGTITARYVPQVSSQFSGFGLAIRDGLNDSAIQAALIVKPELSGQPESPGWHTRLFFRGAKDSTIKDIASGPVLSEPVVTFSRLTGYYWLRLQRKGAIISAYSSVDGKNWAKTGSINRQVKKNALVGLVVSSGLASVPTVVKFDQVTVY